VSTLDNLELTEAEGLANYHVSPEKRENAIKSAKEAGFEVIQSAPNLLLLDFDVPYAGDQKKYYNPEVMDIILQYVETHAVESWASKSGNTHVLVTLGKELPAHHRIALQAALGSDPKREALSVLRLMNGIEEPSLLFKPKAK
jgi:hypothetical protein